MKEEIKLIKSQSYIKQEEATQYYKMQEPTTQEETTQEETTQEQATHIII